MTDELKELMKSALASYEAAGVGGSEGARAMRESLAHIEKLEAALMAADELAVAADKLAKFAFSHMTGGRQDLVDDVADLTRAYRRAIEGQQQ